jgi:RNA polymerase sigma-70 factor (ECF subfamily)
MTPLGTGKVSFSDLLGSYHRRVVAYTTTAAATMEDPRPDAWQQLATHREAIHRHIRSIVRDPAIAEDLTQETLLRAHAKMGNLEDPSRLSSWLYRIATNICYDLFRQFPTHDTSRSIDEEVYGDAEDGPLRVLPDAGPRLDKLMEQQEMSGCVQRYLAELPDTYRAAILLHDEAGMTNPEIAGMLGVTVATVKIRVHRAREKLRAMLNSSCSFSADERGVLICEPKTPKSEV